MKKMLSLFLSLLFSFIFSSSFFYAYSQKEDLGVFEEHGDVGNPKLKGNTVYNKQDQTYLLSGAGKNIWTNIDQFQFVWKKIKGDFIISATVQFIGKGVAGHRKIVAKNRAAFGINQYAMDYLVIIDEGLRVKDCASRLVVGGLARS